MLAILRRSVVSILKAGIRQVAAGEPSDAGPLVHTLVIRLGEP